MVREASILIHRVPSLDARRLVSGGDKPGIRPLVWHYGWEGMVVTLSPSLLLQQGFDQLQSLVINLSSYPSGKVSKAAILEKSESVYPFPGDHTLLIYMAVTWASNFAAS